MTWRDLGPEELERQFNPRRAVPDFAMFQAEKAALSAAVRYGTAPNVGETNRYA